MDNLIHANVQVSMDLYARLIVQAQKHNTSVSEIIKRSVDAFIAAQNIPTNWREHINSMETKQHG